MRFVVGERGVVDHQTKCHHYNCEELIYAVEQLINICIYN